MSRVVDLGNWDVNQPFYKVGSIWQGLSGKSPAIVNKWKWFVKHRYNLAAKEEWTGMHTCEHSSTSSLYLLVGGGRYYWWACVLCGHHIKNEQVKQRICIRFCVMLEHSRVENIWVIQKATAMGSWWLAASPRQHNSCVMSHAEVFDET